MASTGPLHVQSFYIHITTSLKLCGMNPSSGDNESQVCLKLVLCPCLQPNAEKAFAVLMVVQIIISHAGHVPLEPQHSTLPRESPWIQVTSFQNMPLTWSGAEGLYLATQGREESPGSTSLPAFRHRELFGAVEPHAAAISTHRARLSTAQAIAHQGFVSVCTAQTDTTSQLGLLASPGASGRRVPLSSE